jgi:hypothetical protein
VEPGVYLGITAWDGFVLYRAVNGDLGAAVSVPLRTISRLGEMINTTQEIYESGIVGELHELELEIFERGNAYLEALESGEYDGVEISDRTKKVMADYITDIPNMVEDLRKARNSPVLVVADVAGRLLSKMGF